MDKNFELSGTSTYARFELSSRLHAGLCTYSTCTLCITLGWSTNDGNASENSSGRPSNPLSVVRSVREKWQKLFCLIMALHVYIFETILSCLTIIRLPIAALAVNRAVRWPCKTHWSVRFKKIFNVHISSKSTQLAVIFNTRRTYGPPFTITHTTHGGIALRPEKGYVFQSCRIFIRARRNFVIAWRKKLWVKQVFDCR